MSGTIKKGTSDISRKLWRRTARSRLRFELAGLAFALQKESTPEEYARHLWGKGAKGWMKDAALGTGEYLRKEAAAFRCFYPEVGFAVVEAGEERAELVFTEGCLGGWGDAPWALASSLGLLREDVCRYCREAFRVWARQLGLVVRIAPEEDGTCRLCVTKA